MRAWDLFGLLRPHGGGVLEEPEIKRKGPRNPSSVVVEADGSAHIAGVKGGSRCSCLLVALRLVALYLLE